MHEGQVRIIDHSFFRVFVATVIGANMISLGIETDMSCPHCEHNPTNTWFIINSFFASVYLLECGLKLYYDGLTVFRSLSSLIDVFLALLAVVDTWVLYFIFRSGSMRTLSMLRIIRVVRLSRMLKFMTHQPELRLLIQSFHHIHKVLLPMMLLGLFIIYFCSLLVRGMFDVELFESAYPAYSRWNGEAYWGSLPATMFTLFQLSTGDNWAAEIARPIINMNPLYSLFFVPYMLIMSLSFKYTIIAKLCDQIIASGSVAANRQKTLDLRVRQMIQSMRDDFNSPTMTSELLQNFLANQTPERLYEIIDLLNLVDTNELLDLLRIIDVDQTNHADSDMYFNSLTRLSGVAMGKHVTQVQIRASSLVIRIVNILARVAKLNDRIADLIGKELDEIFPSNIVNYKQICA